VGDSPGLTLHGGVAHRGGGVEAGVGVDRLEERQGSPVNWPRRGSAPVGSSSRRWLGRRVTKDIR
jgi:hypothetical protein